MVCTAWAGIAGLLDRLELLFRLFLPRRLSTQLLHFQDAFAQAQLDVDLMKRFSVGLAQTQMCRNETIRPMQDSQFTCACPNRELGQHRPHNPRLILGKSDFGHCRPISLAPISVRRVEYFLTKIKTRPCPESAYPDQPFFGCISGKNRHFPIIEFIVRPCARDKFTQRQKLVWREQVADKGTANSVGDTICHSCRRRRAYDQIADLFGFPKSSNDTPFSASRMSLMDFWLQSRRSRACHKKRTSQRYHSQVKTLAHHKQKQPRKDGEFSNQHRHDDVRKQFRIGAVTEDDG